MGKTVVDVSIASFCSYFLHEVYPRFVLWVTSSVELVQALTLFSCHLHALDGFVSVSNITHLLTI